MVITNKRIIEHTYVQQPYLKIYFKMDLSRLTLKMLVVDILFCYEGPPHAAPFPPPMQLGPAHALGCYMDRRAEEGDCFLLRSL